MKPNVLLCDKLHDAGPSMLDAHAVVHHADTWSRNALLREVPLMDAVIVRTETQVDKEFIDAGCNLRVIGRAGVGLDNIDREAATARGITVVNTPEANTISAAEHTIGMMLAIARHIPQATGATRQGRWERSRFMGTELNGKILGLLGIGRVGSRVAMVASALGMKVIAYDPYIDNFPEGVEEVTYPELIFLDSDFVSLHTPLNEDTRGVVGWDFLSSMKRSAYLINCARGPLVSQSALVSALDEKMLAGYACDVFEAEPVNDPDHPFYKRKNVICTPHIGAQTYEAQERVSLEICTKVKDLLGA